MRTINFHRPEWTHRELHKYYVKFADGRIQFIWAYDAVDALDACNDGTVVEYGNIN